MQLRKKPRWQRTCQLELHFHAGLLTNRGRNPDCDVQHRRSRYHWAAAGFADGYGQLTGPRVDELGADFEDVSSSESAPLLFPWRSQWNQRLASKLLITLRNIAASERPIESAG